MFSQYTWGDFFRVVGSAAALYYLVIGFVFYRRDFTNFLVRLLSKAEPVPQNSAPTSNDGMENRFVVVRDYQGTSANVEVPAKKTRSKTGKPRTKKQKTEKPELPAPESSVSAPASGDKPTDLANPVNAVPEEALASKSIDLENVPVVKPLNEKDMFVALSGTVIPQGEQSLEEVVEDAKQIEREPDGGLVTTSTNERTSRLLKVLMGQGPITEELRGISFPKEESPL